LSYFYHHYYTWQLNCYLYILGSPSKLLYPHMLFIFDGLLGTCFFLYPQYHSVGVCLLIYTLDSGLMCPSIDWLGTKFTYCAKRLALKLMFQEDIETTPRYLLWTVFCETGLCWNFTSVSKFRICGYLCMYVNTNKA